MNSQNSVRSAMDLYFSFFRFSGKRVRNLGKTSRQAVEGRPQIIRLDFRDADIQDQQGDAVLVRLSAVDAGNLENLLRNAWQRQAPPELVKAMDQSRDPFAR